MLKTINSDGSLKISLIGSAVPAGAIYNGGLAYAPDGSLYVKLTQGALSGQTYNGGLACTPDGALYVANSTPAASATFRRGLLCRADGAVHVSDAAVATVRHDGGVPKDNAGRLFVGIPLAGLAASFDANAGITSSAGFASVWADQSGNARHLLQATGANQPIHLPFSGTKYGWLPGVNGNYFSTPDAAANSITGSIDIRYFGTLEAWSAPSFYNFFADKARASASYALYTPAGGTALIFVAYAADGVTARSVSSDPLPFSNNSTHGVRVTFNPTTGKVNFYTSDDGEVWVPLGSELTIATGPIFNGTDPLTVGIATQPLVGKTYWMRIYDTIGGATPAVGLEPSRWTSGATLPGSADETWTINSTGSKPAQIVDRPSLLFDGAAHYMKTAPFTLNQPETVYFVGQQITWTSTDTLLDGNAVNTGAIAQTTGTPQINLNSGASVAGNTEMTLSTHKVICAVFNGASSSLQVTTGTATTGNAGAGNMGGFTLGAAGSNLLFGNIQVHEALIYNVAHDAATRANVIRALMSKHGVA